MTDNTVNKSSGGTKAPAVVQGGRTTSNKMAGVFDSIKLPYEDTVAQKNAQKAADLKRQQEQYNAEKLAQKQAAQAKAAQEKYAREKYIAQMRQKQRDNQFKGTGMQTNTGKNNMYTATPKMYDTPKANTTPAAQKQWNKGVSGQNSTVNSNVLKTNVPKATKAEQDAFINKYLPKLMGTENTPKINYGPNREMAGTVKLNTSKPAVTAPKTAVSTTKPTGPNVEMTKAVKLEGKPQNLRYAIENLKNSKGPSYEISQTRLEGNPQAFYSAVDNMQENKGISRETAKTTFIDSRDPDIFSSYFDEYRYDKIIENAYKPQEEYFVGKDSIYKKDAKELSEDYKNVYNTVQTEYLKRKEDLADLEFYKKYARLDEEGIKNLEKTKAEVEKLDFVRKKAALGAKMNFAFSGNDMDKLSKMSIDDILNSEETDYNLPYLSPGAQFARSTNQSIGQIKNAVDIVNSVKIEFNERRNEFTVFNSKEPQNRFSFKIKNVRSNQGYTEPKIIVDKTPTDYQELIVKDLRDVMDNLTVPDNTEKMLKNLADGKALSVVSGGLDVTSAVLDLTDLAVVLSSDLSDDGKAGDDFSRELFGTAASWAGDYVGGVAGAKAGAALGMVFGPVGAVIGGTLGAVAGAYIMSKVMEDVGRYVGESLDDSDYTIEQYHSRAK